MIWLRLVRSELRKISTTKLHWVFVFIMLAISVGTGTAIVIGTDFDGSKGFIATAEDQRSLLAFGANAMIIAALFGAIATARDYDHQTVVPTFLMSPRRQITWSGQFTAVLIAGGLLGLVGEVFTLAAALITLPMVDFDFMMSTSAVAQVVGAALLGGAAGAVLGAGVGSILRNSAAAATATVVLLLILPPLIVQFVGDGRWVPGALLASISGVADDPGLLVAFGILAAWALAPAALALFVVGKRDIA